MADSTRQNNTRRDVNNKNQQVVKPLPFKPVKSPMPLQNLIGITTGQCVQSLQVRNRDSDGNPILDSRQMRKMCRDLFKANSISRPPIKPEKENLKKSNIIRNTKEI